MFYTIYKTTNRINGKFYIGAHKTEDLNDNYLGSGKLLKRAIEKYGIENFEKRILFVFETAEEMFAKEAELVTDEFLSEHNTYNLKIGGFGGFDYLNIKFDNPTHHKAHMQKMANARQLMFPNGTMKGKKHSEETKVKLREHLSTLSGYGFKGKQHSQSTKDLIASKTKHSSAGSRNSQYGTMWITDGASNKKLKNTDKIPDGWYKGMTVKTMESKPIGDRDFLLRSSIEQKLDCGSGPLLSANTDEEQQLIDEIVEMTSDLYDLDYAK